MPGSFTIILFIFCQDRDLKSYMDDCGGILSMTNVRVGLTFENCLYPKRVGT
jgi:hypothetical protein